MDTWRCSLLLVGLWVYTVRGFPTNEPQPIVKTIYGDLRGLQDMHYGQTFEAFKGVPFAKPPVGSLRWERPQSPDKWTGVRDATTFRSVCTQRGNDGSSEDCLYLNVYIPNGVQDALKNPLPVMVWVHGGGLSVGNGNMYRGQELALTGQVIVVTFNYRLDVLGGLSTSDANIPGNYHLWDARAALLWVRDNIKNFGGDRSRVTLIGQSSGGTVVSCLAASPLTQGLIHRAVAMSGASTGPIGFQHQSRKMAQDLGLVEECPQGSTEQLAKCLRGKDARSLIDSGFESAIVYGGRLPGWLPVVDGQMLTSKPKDAWAAGAARNIDYMIGSAEHDAASFVYLTTYGARGEGTEGLADDKDVLQLALRFLLQTYARGDDVQSLLDAILRQYPDIDSNNVTARTKAIVQSTSDWIFASAAHREAQNHSRTATGKKTFMYNFHYRPSFVHYKDWVKGSHNDDLHFTFGEPFLNSYRREKLGSFSKEDTQLKEDMMHYFANFAYTGDPNKGPHKTAVSWPQYDPEEKQFLELSSKSEVKKEDAERLRRLNFWINEWPKITVPEESYMHQDAVPAYIKKIIQNVDATL